MTKRIYGLIILVLIVLPFHANKAWAEEQSISHTLTQIHEVAEYPDHILIHSSYKTHIVSVDAFLEQHKDLTLIKENNGELFVLKKVVEASPISTIVALMGIKGEEALQVETATFNPFERVKSFLQFEMDAFTT